MILKDKINKLNIERIDSIIELDLPINIKVQLLPFKFHTTDYDTLINYCVRIEEYEFAAALLKLKLKYGSEEL